MYSQPFILTHIVQIRYPHRTELRRWRPARRPNRWHPHHRSHREGHHRLGRRVRRRLQRGYRLCQRRVHRVDLVGCHRHGRRRVRRLPECARRRWWMLRSFGGTVMAWHIVVRDREPCKTVDLCSVDLSSKVSLHSLEIKTILHVCCL